MPWNPSNELLKKYLEDLDRRQPSKRGLLGPCPFGFSHKGVLSQGLNQRENIGWRFEICCPPEKGDPRCFLHGKPSRSQPSCEALADMFFYIASLEVAPWGDESFIDFACASTIAFNHRAVQARVDPPGALQRHWLAYQRAFPPYVDLPAYRVTAPALEPLLMVTPVTFAGLLSKPFPRKTGLLPPCDHRVKVCVALYQINNFQASLLDCVGIKRGEIVEFTLRQTGIFKELGIQDTDRRVLALLEIYLPAQAKWSRALHPSDKLHLAFGEGVIYRLPHMKRTPDLSQIIQQIIPPALLGGGATLLAISTAHTPAPASLSLSLSLSLSSALCLPANVSPITKSISATAVVFPAHRSEEGSSCSSFMIRKNGRLQRASCHSPISMAERRSHHSTALSAPMVGVNISTSNSRHQTASAKLQPSKAGAPRQPKLSKAVAKPLKAVAKPLKVVATEPSRAVATKPSKAATALSDQVIEIEDDIVKGSARFWQRHLKYDPDNRCLRAEGTQSNPIDLMDVDSEIEDVPEDAL